MGNGTDHVANLNSLYGLGRKVQVLTAVGVKQTAV